MLRGLGGSWIVGLYSEGGGMKKMNVSFTTFKQSLEMSKCQHADIIIYVTSVVGTYASTLKVIWVVCVRA